MAKKDEDRDVTRRHFIKKGTALGLGTTGLAGLSAEQHAEAGQTRPKWDRVADVVIAGAGASGLCAAIMARDQGASVIVIEENHDIGGHAMLSGGRIPLGGGTSMQKKWGIADSADLVYQDHTNYKTAHTGTATVTSFVSGPMRMLRRGNFWSRTASHSTMSNRRSSTEARFQDCSLPRSIPMTCAKPSTEGLVPDLSDRWRKAPEQRV